MYEEFLWTEKYRPNNLNDVILPDRLKNEVRAYVKAGNIPNVLFVGSQGIGKTTVAMALCEELGADYIVVNGSKEGNLDTLRNKIEQFVSTISFSGGRKYVILDEADGLTKPMQEALRNFMETYSANAGFILTCNYLSKIIEPLWSRNPKVEFDIKKGEAQKVAAAFFERALQILELENVEYDKAVVAKVIQRYYPDWRRALGELHRFSLGGRKIDTGVLSDLDELDIGDLLVYMKKKEYSNVRKWVAENSDNTTGVYRKFYDQAANHFDKRYVPQAIITLAKYQYQSSFAVDPEIQLSGCLAEILIEAIWNE